MFINHMRYPVLISRRPGLFGKQELIVIKEKKKTKILTKPDNVYMITHFKQQIFCSLQKRIVAILIIKSFCHR